MALDAILAHKRTEVAAREAARPLAHFVENLRRSDRSFRAALSGSHPAFILEVKYASPSQGTIRQVVDVPAVLAAYAPHASAISVLTDERFFGGSFDRLREVRRQVTQPVLCKDFILGPYQVAEARAHGADAVLLMLSVLDDRSYRACAAVAHSLDMDVLTEAHTAEEMERAETLGASIIGINNRDLRTLAVDPSTTERLAPLAPKDALVIAESGIGSRRDVERLQNLVDGFLVGTALMRRPDVDRATRELIYGATKVCGLTREADARAALEAGATHGGLIFAPESPRAVSLEQAVALTRAVPLEWVGVFVNAAPEYVAQVAGICRLAAVQLHGEESADYVRSLKCQLPEGCALWKAVRVRDDAIPHPDAIEADYLLLDAYAPQQRGGTGRTFDWSRLTGLPLDRLVVSGGLSPDNVGEASQLGAAMLDVNSGVESAPGHKDAARLARFFSGRRGRRRVISS